MNDVKRINKIVGEATAKLKHKQRKLYGDGSMEVSMVALARLAIVEALQEAGLFDLDFYAVRHDEL